MGDPGTRIPCFWNMACFAGVLRGTKKRKNEKIFSDVTVLVTDLWYSYEKKSGL